MKQYRFLLCTAIVLLIGWIVVIDSCVGQQLKQIQPGTARNQITVTNGKQYTQVYRDAKTYILDTLQIRDSIIAWAMDSIYLNDTNDTIFLRDGSGYAAFPQEPCAEVFTVPYFAGVYTYPLDVPCGTLGVGTNYTLHWWDGDVWQILVGDARELFDFTAYMDSGGVTINQSESGGLNTSLWIRPGYGLLSNLETYDDFYPFISTQGNFSVDSTKFATPYDLTQNDKQKIDTFQIVANKLRLSLQRDAERYKEVDLTPYVIPTFTNGSVIYSDGTTLSENNASLFWDNSNLALQVAGIPYRSNGSNSAFIGVGAGSSSSASNSNFIGTEAGNNATNASSSNFIGNGAGNNATNASNTIAIGTRAGMTFTDNDISYNNIIIGNNISLPNSERHGMNLGGLIFGKGMRDDIVSDPFIDAANGQVGIMISNPTQALHVGGSLRVQNGIFDSANSAGSPAQVLTSDGSNILWANPAAEVDGSVTNEKINNIAWRAQSGADSLQVNENGTIYRTIVPDFLTGAGAANKVAFWNATNTLNNNTNFHWDNTNARLGIGTAIPSAILDVRSNTGTVFGAKLDNGGVLFDVESNGRCGIGLLSWFPTNTRGNTKVAGAGGCFIGLDDVYNVFNGSTTATAVTTGRPLNRLLNATSGAYFMHDVVGNFAPTSGTATFNALTIMPTINQTGGANGISRGIRIDPTITAAADFRGLEILHNSHYSLYQSGASSKNYFNGNTGFGIDNPSEKVHVSGNLRVTGNYRDSSNDIGANGEVLSSTVTGTNWIAVADNSSTNEMQTISKDSAGTAGNKVIGMTLSNGGGRIATRITDNQDLSLSANTLSLTNDGTTVDLTPLTANQNITLTGEVIGTGTTSIAATISNNAVVTAKINDGAVTTPKIADDNVTFAKMNNVASGTVFYRKSALTGDPEIQTLSTLKSDLGLANTNNGDQTIDQFNILSNILNISLLNDAVAPLTVDLSPYVNAAETDPLALKAAGDLSPLFTTTETANNLAFTATSQAQALMYASPAASTGVPTFRAIATTDVPTLNQNTTGSAAKITTPRTISVTGDLAYTTPSFDGSANVTAAGTLATVNSNVGSFTNASITVNGKGLITAASSGTAVTGESTTVTDGTYIDHTLTGFAISSTIIAQSIDSTRLGPRSVNNSELATDAVTTVKILDGNITTTKIAANAVTSTEINDNTIVAADLATTGVGAGTYNSLTVNTKGQVTAGLNVASGLTADANVNKYLMKATGTAIDTVGIYQVGLNKFNIGGTATNNLMGDNSLTITNPSVSTLVFENTLGSRKFNSVGNIDGLFSILKGTTAFFYSLLEFDASDSITIKSLRDNVSTRLVTASPTGKLATLPAYTSGSVIFSNGSTLSHDNANLFFDNTNNRLGIKTATPLKDLHVVGTARITDSDGTSTSLMGRDADGDISVASLATGLNIVSGALTIGTLNQNTTGSAATLTTGRTIGMTGDILYTSGSFNGSANVTGTAEIQAGVVGATELATTGVGAGTYNSLTVNTKGQVTAATAQNLFDGNDISPGTGIVISGSPSAITITNSAPNVQANLGFTGASSPVTLTSSDGSDVTITAGDGVALSATTVSNLTITALATLVKDFTTVGTTVGTTVITSTELVGAKSILFEFIGGGGGGGSGERRSSTTTAATGGQGGQGGGYSFFNLTPAQLTALGSWGLQVGGGGVGGTGVSADGSGNVGELGTYTGLYNGSSVPFYFANGGEGGAGGGNTLITASINGTDDTGGVAPTLTRQAPGGGGGGGGLTTSNTTTSFTIGSKSLSNRNSISSTTAPNGGGSAISGSATVGSLTTGKGAGGYGGGATRNATSGVGGVGNAGVARVTIFY